jgi:hypothetical protein
MARRRIDVVGEIGLEGKRLTEISLLETVACMRIMIEGAPATQRIDFQVNVPGR